VTRATSSMCRLTGLFCAMAAVVADQTARGDVVIEQWAVGERASHPKSVRVLEAAGAAGIVEVDLSALAANRPRVYQARLLAAREPVTGADEEAMVKVEIFPLDGAPPAGGAPPGKAPLKLIPPWYDCFDATEAVRVSVAGQRKCRFYVKAFPKWVKDSTRLEVTYEGKLPSKLPPAVKDLKVLHRAGQTFIAFKEIDDPFGGKPVTLGQLRQAREQAEAARRVRYRIYRHDKPIDGKSLAQAELLAEVKPFSGFNVRGVSLDRLICQHQLRAVEDSLFARKIAGGPFRGYRPDMPEMAEVEVSRLVIKDGPDVSGLPPGTGLYVHHPTEPGRAHYVVVVAVDGTAGAREVKSAAVEEQVGPGEPVFQGVEDLKVFYDYPGQRRRYVQWCAPPLSHLPNQYHNWGVYLPTAASEGKPLALGIYFHDWQGLYLRPHWPHPKNMILISPQDRPRPTFAYGHHEALDTLRSFAAGGIHDYTARRIDAFIEWLCGKFAIDKARMSCHGSGAYGGSSAIAYALRYPERFALVVAGAFDANPGSVEPIIQIGRNRRRTHLKALEAVWGKKEWTLKTADGRNIWEDRDMVAFVKTHPKSHLPFMSLGTGSQHSTWPQENALLKALMAARQPFRTDFTWGGQAPHFGPMYVRRDKPMLAAVPTSEQLAKTRWYGDPHWQQAATGYWGGGHTMINMGLSWKIDDIVDTPERLEIDGYASGEVTLRNVQAFKLKPGEKVHWQVKGERRPYDQSGEAAADEYGLLTVPGFRGRLIVTRGGSEATQQEGKQE